MKIPRVKQPEDMVNKIFSIKRKMLENEMDPYVDYLELKEEELSWLYDQQVDNIRFALKSNSGCPIWFSDKQWFLRSMRAGKSFIFLGVRIKHD